MDNKTLQFKLREMKRKLNFSIREELLLKDDEVETIAGNGKIVSVGNGKVIVKLSVNTDFPGQEMEYDIRQVKRISESVKPGEYKTKGGETITVKSVGKKTAIISGNDVKDKEIDLDALKHIIVESKEDKDVTKSVDKKKEEEEVEVDVKKKKKGKTQSINKEKEDEEDVCERLQKIKESLK